MYVKSLNFSEKHLTPNLWSISDVVFGKVNLIVGKNATGKTRMMNVLRNLSLLLSGKSPNIFNGEWQLTFKKNKETFVYNLKIVNREVEYEIILLNEKKKMHRSKNNSKIFSEIENKFIEYDPPDNKLTIQVRRDKKEYPFLEDLFNWGENFYGINFSGSSPNELLPPQTFIYFSPLESIGNTPYILEKCINEYGIKRNIVKDMNKVGYPIEDIGVDTILPPKIKAVKIKEKELECKTIQPLMSFGMYRALAMIVIINYLWKLGKPCTFAVDDIGEGLDHERAFNLIKIILNKVKKSEIQVILTSNDRFTLNAVNVRYWNILEREGHNVRAYNYYKNKKFFNDFNMIGLSNFELFSGKMYKNNSEE